MTSRSASAGRHDSLTRPPVWPAAPQEAMGWPGPRACTTAAVSLAFMLERADERLLSAVYTPLGQALHASPAQLGTLTMWRALVQVAHAACQPPSAVLLQSVPSECSSPCQDSLCCSPQACLLSVPLFCSPCLERTEPTACGCGANDTRADGSQHRRWRRRCRASWATRSTACTSRAPAPCSGAQ